MYDLIIIGGGPAGLTAAIYAIRKRLNVLLVGHDLGGKINLQMSLPWIEAHQTIRGVDVVEKFRRELEYLDFARLLETVKHIEKKDNLFMVTTVGGAELSARSLIVASGSRMKHLNVPGEQEYFGRGLSYSAISHAPLFIGRHTAVIGDGKLALRAVAELSQIAASVHLVASKPAATLDTAMAHAVLDNNIKVVVLQEHKVKAIHGNGYVERIILETPEGQEAEIGTDGVFVELGLIPNSELVRSLTTLDEQGRIIVDNRQSDGLSGSICCRRRNQRLFRAGTDCRWRGSQSRP